MHEPDDEDYLARPAAIRMERAVKRFDLTDRRPNFGGNHSLGDSSEVREGLLAGGTTGSLAGMTMVMCTVKLKIESDDDAAPLVELPMRPNLVADGMSLRSCSKLLARVQHDACSLPCRDAREQAVVQPPRVRGRTRNRPMAALRLDLRCSS